MSIELYFSKDNSDIDGNNETMFPKPSSRPLRPQSRKLVRLIHIPTTISANNSLRGPMTAAVGGENDGE
jgi:hypothetical protein